MVLVFAQSYRAIISNFRTFSSTLKETPWSWAITLGSPLSQLLATTDLPCVISSWAEPWWMRRGQFVKQRGPEISGRWQLRIAYSGGMYRQGIHGGPMWAQPRIWGRVGQSMPHAMKVMLPTRATWFLLVARDLRVWHRHFHLVHIQQTVNDGMSKYISHALLKHHKGLSYFIYNMKLDMWETYMYTLHSHGTILLFVL